METTDKLPTSTLTPQAAMPSAYDQPDWASRVQDVACPLCHYNLRGLIDPRCPECGYQFAWPDLLDPARQRHPYLFELHPESNFKSFWKTAFHGLRPIKFWKSVRADQRCVPRRVRLYGCIVAVVFLIGFVSDIGVAVLDYNVQRWATARSTIVWSGPSSPYSITAATAPVAFEWPYELELAAFVIPAAIILMWPWLTFASLHLLRISMRQAKIGSAHVLRCVVYSWDIVLWAAIITLAANALESIMMLLDPTRSSVAYYTTPYWGFWIPVGAWAFLLPVFIYRMAVAYRLYLRFRHAIATILLTQAIVLLCTVAVIIYCGELNVDAYRWIRNAISVLYG